MNAIAWVLAGFFALLSGYFAFRGRRGFSADVADTPQSANAPATPGLADPREQALRGMARYMGAAVLRPLEEGLRKGDLRRAAEDAIDALRDLAFHAKPAGESATGTENMLSVIKDVTGEFTLESGTHVKLRGPDDPVRVNLAAERFKDATFLLLSNASRFGGGQTVEVIVEEKKGQVEVKIRDRGPGFSREALARAFEPFWTTESDALGLGLFQAKRLLGNQGGALRVGNANGGGGEVVISLPRVR